jgi:hypothetical protein
MADFTHLLLVRKLHSSGFHLFTFYLTTLPVAHRAVISECAGNDTGRNGDDLFLGQY